MPRAGCYDSTAAKEIRDVTCNGDFVVLTGTADPITFPGNVQLNASSADASTLATPVSGSQPAGDDGKTLFIVDLSGQAHTVTTASNKIINSKKTLTWNGTVGSNCMLMAMGGVWVPIALAGVAVS
jgi:hypothetical protein